MGRHVAESASSGRGASRIEAPAVATWTEQARVQDRYAARKSSLAYRNFCSDTEAGSNGRHDRSEEHTSELQSPMRISYAVFCLQTKHGLDHTSRTTTSAP